MISVILPVFNSEKFIYDSVSSIINQTYIDFELLILDDGSTDSSLDIIKSFNDNRIKIFSEPVNKGIIFQLNKGISLAKGEFIARMDADDISYPERFQKQIEFFEDSKNIRIDVLGSDAISFGLSQNTILHHNYLPRQISFILNFKCPILHPTVMIRKSVFEKGIYYPTNYEYAEDYAFWRLIDNGKNIAILPVVLLNYRLHDNQTNKSSQRFIKQYNSALSIANFNGVSFFEKIFISYKLRSKSINIQFGVFDNYKPRVYEKIYIWYKKKTLKIKNQFMTDILNTY